MTIQAASATIITRQLAETRKFYEKLFQATSSFDCGWYVVLRLSKTDNAPELCLMEPQDNTPAFSGGLFVNLKFDQVDQIHKQIVQTGITPVIPLEDHPWGDRGFGIIDPSGVTVYCYQSIDPTAEYQKYFVTQ